MIYLSIFIYLLFLSIHYDILENKKYKWIHFKIVITLLILVAGLRWRIGADTVLYAHEFVYSHDLFHLELSDFESMGRMPFWVLLYAVCKTIWNDFLLVQFVIAAFTITVSGYFVKKVCPSLCFFILLCYYIGGRYSSLHLELLREAMAVSFYLLGILAVNERKNKRALLFYLCAVMFHVFAIIAILIFVFCYYLLPKNSLLRLFFCFALLFIVLFDNDFIVSIIEKNIGILIVNEEVALRILGYTTGDKYGNTEKSIVNYMWLILQFLSYIFMLYKIDGIYSKSVLMKRDLFDVGVFICVVLLCIKYSFLIVYRIGGNYNYFFTCLLSVVFTKELLLAKVKYAQRIFVYIILLIIPLFFCFKLYLNEDYVYENNRWYFRYYPYSSVFDKSLNYDRERLHQFRGSGYSKNTDY